MDKHGGRQCKMIVIDRGIHGTNAVAGRALKCKDKELDRVMAIHKKNFSREQEKLKRQLEQLKVEKVKQESSRHRDLAKTPDPSGGLHAKPHGQDERSSHRLHHGVDGHVTASHKFLNKSHVKLDQEHGELHLKRSATFKKGGKATQMKTEDSKENVKEKPAAAVIPNDPNPQQVPIPVVKIGIEDSDSSNPNSRHSFNSDCSLTKALKLNPAASIRSFYDAAIKKYSQASVSRPSDEDIKLKNQTSSTLSQESKRQGMSSETLPELDRDAFRELEGIIKEAKMNALKKDNSSTHYSSRHKQRRIRHLEQLMEELRPKIRHEVVFDPMSILECQYLRLSKANIESLEKMVKESGKDPGIHAHSDVKDFNIWK